MSLIYGTGKNSLSFQTYTIKTFTYFYLCFVQINTIILNFFIKIVYILKVNLQYLISTFYFNTFSNKTKASLTKVQISLPFDKDVAMYCPIRYNESSMWRMETYVVSLRVFMATFCKKIEKLPLYRNIFKLTWYRLQDALC